MFWAKIARLACTPPFRLPAAIFFWVALPNFPLVPFSSIASSAFCIHLATTSPQYDFFGMVPGRIWTRSPDGEWSVALRLVMVVLVPPFCLTIVFAMMLPLSVGSFGFQRFAIIFALGVQVLAVLVWIVGHFPLTSTPILRII